MVSGNNPDHFAMVSINKHILIFLDDQLAS